jgi:hypothetical protein
MSLSKNKEILGKYEPGYQALIQSQEVIKTKKDFHELLDRNGFHMIPYKSAGNTVEYLKHVRAMTVWCPLYVDVRLRTCYQPPRKEIVYKEVLSELKRLNLPPFGFKNSLQVPAEWLIRCLSTLNPEHRFFDKGYYPDEVKVIAKQRKRHENQIIMRSDDKMLDGIMISQNETAKNTISLSESRIDHKMGLIDTQLNLA